MTRPYLCSFHIPKTGGTTFSYHVRKFLPPGEFAPYGRFSNLTRFFNDEPQLEELPDAATARIRVIHGHGSGLRMAERLKGRLPEFAVILRDPYRRFLSGFAQQTRNRPRHGLKSFSFDNYVARRGVNPVAEMLKGHFGGLIAPDAEVTFDALMPILQSFKYVLVTEQLDRQLPALCEAIELPAKRIEPRRVAAEKVEPPIDRDTFEQMNPVDLEIYQAAAKATAPLGNPFGYQPERVRDHLNDIWAAQTRERVLADAYTDLVRAAVQSSQLLAMQVKLTRTPARHVSDKPLLLRLVEAELDGWLSGLDDSERATAHAWCADVLSQAKQRDSAREEIDKALQLDPSNQLARKVQYEMGRWWIARLFSR